MPRGKLWAIRNFYRNPGPAEDPASRSLFTVRFSSRLLAAGIALIEVSAWMGHGLRAGGHEVTNTTTRVYAHATGESREAALDELATLIAGTDPGRERRAT